MSDFKIESDVPLKEGKRRAMYPFAAMKVGDSFFVPTNEKDKGAQWRTVYNSGRNYCLKHRPDAAVVVRAVDGGYRVWLVAKP